MALTARFCKPSDIRTDLAWAAGGKSSLKQVVAGLSFWLAKERRNASTWQKVPNTEVLTTVKATCSTLETNSSSDLTGAGLLLRGLEEDFAVQATRDEEPAHLCHVAVQHKVLPHQR